MISAAVGCAALLAPSSTWAQNEDKKPQQDDAATKPANEDEGGRGAGRPRSQRTPREVLAAVHKLHETMKQDFVLTEATWAEVDELFNAYVADYRQDEPADAEQQEAERKARLEAIRGEIRAAREAGDQEKLRDLRMEMVELRQKLYQPQPFEAAARLTEDVAAKLEGEQRGKFLKMAQRLGVAPPANRRGPLADVTMILRDPDIGITPEQNDKIRKIIREIMSDNRELGRDEAGRAELGEKIEKAVLDELTPQQAAKYKEKKAQAQAEEADGGKRRDARTPRRGGKDKDDDK
jgi:hypothetical protein